MLIILAYRNVIRNFRRLIPMMATLILVFTLLIMGNAILDAIVDSLYNTYARNVTGDLTISPVAKDNFTVFGSDQLLVGKYIIPPTLTDAQKIIETLSSWPNVRACTGLITSAARVEIGTQKQNSTVFGVDFSSYPDTVPGLKLVSGTFPDVGTPGLVIQEDGWQDPESLIGKKALLASTLGRSFTLREATVTGIISYPVKDPMLQNIVLVDATTSRALNGYLYGNTNEKDISEEELGIIEGELDDMFSEPQINANDSKDQDENSVDYTTLLSRDSESSLDAFDFGTQGAWNFIVISLYRNKDTDDVTRRLASEGYERKNGFRVRDWSSSVGGNAQLSLFLQFLFNVGLLFVSLGAVIIATNALLLSVLERTGEIGTLRAIGAAKFRISVLIFMETLFVVFGSALIGIIIGKFATDSLNNAEIVIDNPYIKILFGGRPIRGKISTVNILTHLSVALVFSIFSMLYPLKRALSIQPVEAMAE